MQAAENCISVKNMNAEKVNCSNIQINTTPVVHQKRKSFMSIPNLQDDRDSYILTPGPIFSPMVGVSNDYYDDSGVITNYRTIFSPRNESPLQQT